MLSYSNIPTHVTALYVFAVINLTILLNLSLVEANVLIADNHNKTLWEAPDRQALFGPRLTEDGVWGHLVYITTSGCTEAEVSPPPNGTSKWIAMIKRGDCEFDTKVYNAQKKKYVAAIIHNVDSDELIPMGPSHKHLTVEIPSVFIGAHDAEQLRRFAGVEKYSLWINNQTTINYWPLLKDFIIIACGAFAFGLLIGLAVLVVRWIRDVQRRRRSRLSLSHLKKIPVKKYKKGDQYDMCAICLDDYEEGDKLRILPCSHAYHQKCIDPWLTKNKKFCPICKRKVLPGRDDSDSEEDSDDESGESENRPLLGATAANNRAQARGGGTFDNSGLPAAMRDHVHPLSYDGDSSSDDDYSLSTSNYQSSVEVHQAARQTDTLITLADETTSVGSGDTESADSDDNNDVVPSSAHNNIQVYGAVGGEDNPAFSIVVDHFGTTNPDPLTDDDDDVSKSSMDEYRPLMEEPVIPAALPREASPFERDQIV